MPEIRVVCQGICVTQDYQTDAEPPRIRAANRETKPNGETNRNRRLLEHARQEMRFQVECGRHIDNKMGVVCGFGILAVGQVFVGMLLTPSETVKILKAQHGMLHFTMFLLVVALVSALVAISLSLWTLKPLPWRGQGFKRELERRRSADPEISDDDLTEAENHFSENARLLKQKMLISQRAAWALGIFFMSFCVLSAVLGYAILGGA